MTNSAVISHIPLTHNNISQNKMKFTKISNYFNSKNSNNVNNITEQTLLSKSCVDWSVDEVNYWLKLNGFVQFAKSFNSNQVDGEVLLQLDDHDLSSLGIHFVTDLRKIKSEIAQLKAKTSKYTKENSTIIIVNVKVDFDEFSQSFSYQCDRKKVLLNDLFDLVNASLKDDIMIRKCFEYVDEQNDTISITKQSHLRIILSNLCDKQNQISLRAFACV